MADAKRDNNYVTTLLGVSNVDGVTPVVLWADPVTHRLLVDSSGSGGATAFTDLTDVPASYSGQSLKGVRVNAGETGLEFFTIGSGTPGGSNTQIQYNNAGAFGGVTGATTDGTTLTLVAPILGTPASVTLTNATGLPLTTGVTGNLPVTNLNSGTSASATTFWRGDGTWATPSGGGNTFNDYYIDQTPDNGTYGLLGGTVNGSNTQFTVSQGVYATGTLLVDLNGQLMTQGVSNDWVETTPASGTFDFVVAPETGSVVTARYAKQVTNSDTILVDGSPITDLDATAWRVFYSDGSGNITELALGASGTVLQSNGASSAPTFATPSGGVSDGDKGDITVSASGATWTIDNDVVTYAKIQNVSATDRILGRDTAGAGDIEELTVSNGLEFTGTGIQRSALTGHITASAGSNATTLGSFTLAQLNTAVSDANIIPEAGGTFTGDISVPDEAYGVGWNGSAEVPTKNAVYDKIEAIGGVAGTLNVNTTAVGNVTTGEDDLITYSVTGNTLGANSDYLSFEAAGIFAATINNKRIKVKFGATTLFDTGALAITTANDWRLHGTIVRTASNAYRAAVEFSSSSSVLSSSADYQTGTDDLTTALTLKLTGEATATDDIIQNYMVTRVNSSTTDALSAYAPKASPTFTGTVTLPADTSLTTPTITGTPNAAGEIGYNSTTGQLTQYSGLTASVGQIPRVLSVSRPGDSLTNSTTADQDFASVYTIPANVLTTNKVIRVTLNMSYTTGVSTATVANYLKLGSTKIWTGGASNIANSLTGQSLTVSFNIIGTATPGASVSVEAGGPNAHVNGGGVGAHNTVVQPVAGIATNGTLAITPGLTFSATGSTDTYTILSAIVEELN